ncbi:MAG: U32 family peptidase [Treponema sp.]|nr:U32 family peptidase [Treponema sp.]
MIDKNLVELLAPAGDEECFKAAIAAGADAVYFGMEQFSARTRAKNITVNQAKYLIPLAHQHNCKTYLTLNTLITDKEMQTALSLVEKAVECGIDAVIIQDLGVLNLVHSYFPDLELHASTQMTTHNLSQCAYLSKLGVSQINLSRELSLPELQKNTTYLHSQHIIPEIFVHGAFCISYSGQCYLSEHLYNQAGNRGDCVQPCRRNWCTQTSIKDAASHKSSFQPLFHLKDNCAFPLADKLINQNMPLSLKIEGRIKNAEYVWAVTSAWREQINLILAEKNILKSSPKLTGAINRDYTCGYLEGNISSQMFSNGTKDVSQIKAGTVKNYIADSKTLILNNGELIKGDRLTIKTPSNQFICTATVTEKNSKGYNIQITNKLTKKIVSGQIVYKNSSVITPEQLSKIINQLAPENKLQKNCNLELQSNYKIDISVKALENQPLMITVISQGQQVSVKSNQLLVKAQNAGLTPETLQQKLTKLGGTCFSLNSFTIETLDPNLFIPLGELNNLRRQAIELLIKKLEDAKISSPSPITKRQELIPPFSIEKRSNQTSSTKAYLVDNIKTLEQLLQKQSLPNKTELTAQEISSPKNDFKIIFELPSAINIVPLELFELLNQNPQVVLYFNSILMDQDLKNTLDFLNQFNNLTNREILCENTGLAHELKKIGCKIILGPNCNIYNSWNIQQYIQTLNPWAIIPSLELQSDALENLHFPENVQIWYPKKLQTLLMQSRQCLVKNGSNCTKACVNRACLENCQKTLLLKGTQNENIIAVKRKGFYSALYSTEKKYTTKELFEKKVSTWIIDNRSFS